MIKWFIGGKKDADFGYLYLNREIFGAMSIKSWQRGLLYLLNIHEQITPIHWSITAFVTKIDSTIVKCSPLPGGIFSPQTLYLHPPRPKLNKYLIGIIKQILHGFYRGSRGSIFPSVLATGLLPLTLRVWGNRPVASTSGEIDRPTSPLTM